LNDKKALLWYDDNPKLDLAEKIAQAAQRYKQKHGASPDVCYVHPSALGSDSPKSVGDVRVLSLGTVLLHHFWIGREEKPNPKQGAAQGVLL